MRALQKEQLLIGNLHPDVCPLDEVKSSLSQSLTSAGISSVANLVSIYFLLNEILIERQVVFFDQAINHQAKER